MRKAKVINTNCRIPYGGSQSVIRYSRIQIEMVSDRLELSSRFSLRSKIFR